MVKVIIPKKNPNVGDKKGEVREMKKKKYEKNMMKGERGRDQNIAK